MASYTTTARHALRRLTGGSLVSEVDNGIAALADDIDVRMVVGSQGLLSARPVSTPGSPGIVNRLYTATDLGLGFLDTGSGWFPIGIPIGGGIDWYGFGDPCAEIVICDGRAISRSTYAGLFTKLSTTFGAGDGSTTFNIPSAADRMLVGVSGTIARGATGGEKTHVLTTAEMPSHTHGYTAALDVATIDAGSFTNVAHAANATTTATGGGTAHNNMSPFLGAYKAIRVL